MLLLSNRDKDKDKEKSSSNRDKEKESRDKDKDKDRHKSSSSSKHKSSSSSSSKHRDKDRHHKSSSDRDRHRNKDRDKDRKDKVKDEPRDDAGEVKREPFTEPDINDVDIKDEQNNVSQASSCDYSLSQFRPDESQFTIKAEADDNDEVSYVNDADPLADDDEDDEDDVPIVIYCSHDSEYDQRKDFFSFCISRQNAN